MSLWKSVLFMYPKIFFIVKPLDTNVCAKRLYNMCSIPHPLSLDPEFREGKTPCRPRNWGLYVRQSCLSKLAEKHFSLWKHHNSSVISSTCSLNSPAPLGLFRSWCCWMSPRTSPCWMKALPERSSTAFRNYARRWDNYFIYTTRSGNESDT